MASQDCLARSLQAQAPVRTLIVDDERLSRERVRSLLERKVYVDIVGECANGLEALHAIEAEAPDLVFLDVEMPELNGLAVLEKIEPEQCPHIVFITAFEKYLQRAFEVHALDYLRKPFTDERFYDALGHACRRVEERLSRSKMHEAVSLVLTEVRQRAAQIRDRLMVQDKERGLYHVILTREIEWIEAKNGGVLIHTGKQVYADRRTLADIEARLDPSAFLRVHRSRIVNRTRIAQVKPLWRSEYMVVLASGQKFDTGRTYHEAVERFLESM